MFLYQSGWDVVSKTFVQILDTLDLYVFGNLMKMSTWPNNHIDHLILIVNFCEKKKKKTAKDLVIKNKFLCFTRILYNTNKTADMILTELVNYNSFPNMQFAVTDAVSLILFEGRILIFQDTL